MEQPLILVTNDDGYDSSGLWAVVQALVPLGEVMVVAPNRQWSGGGRSMPHSVTGEYEKKTVYVEGQPVVAYAVDASPALTVVHAVTELAPRRPDLVVSGVNFGSNLGTEVTVSGTVGAALEGGAFGIPSLALSLEMDSAYHLTGSDNLEYAATQAYAHRFAQCLLDEGLRYDVDILSINLPSDATPDTPWWLTRLSRQRYYWPTPPDRRNGQGRPGYQVAEDFTGAAFDSDVYAVKVARVISVTPLSLDLTSRTSFDLLNSSLRVQENLRQQAPRLNARPALSQLTL